MKEVKFWGMMAMMLCAMVMGSSSCSDDEDGLPGGATADMLIGTWEGVEAYVWSKEDGEYYDEPDTEDTSNTRMEYKEDGTVLGFEYYGGQWHLESEEGKWRISGDKLIVAISEGGESYEITSKVLKLTATELELEIYEKYKEEGVTYEEYAKDIFRKVD